jgi:XrtJ-associated TM-motif-TM protein
MKRSALFALTALVVLLAAPAYAQTGGVNCTPDQGSPENPTIILALAGSAGAVVAAARQRFRRK